MVVLFKACPRCSGDLLVNSDMHGRYVECFQCGYLAEATEEQVASWMAANPRMEPMVVSTNSKGEAA